MVENGVRKKNAQVLVLRAEMLVTQYVLSSSCHLVTPLIYIHFCVWLGLFVDCWWLKEVWYAPDFLSNCNTRVPLAAPGITRSSSKRICRGMLSQKTRNWPTCKPVNVHERCRQRRSSFDLAQLCRQLDSVEVLLRKQVVLMLTFMVNVVALSPTHKEARTETPMLFPRAKSSIWRYGAKPRKRTRSLKFLRQKNNEEVSDWYHTSKYWLFATFARLFSSPRASSCCLPSFTSRRRLLGLHRRSFRTSGCRSGVHLDDLGAKKDYEEMLAKKLKAWHRRTRVGPQTECASQLSIAKMCAGWAPHRLHSHAQPARRVNFGSFAKACHTTSFYSGFLLFLEQQRAHKYYSLTKNQERTTLPSTTSDLQRAWFKHKYVCKSKEGRDGANLKAHVASRAFPREIPVRGRFFFKRRFQPLLLEDFSQTNRNRLVGAPRAHFCQKLKINN